MSEVQGNSMPLKKKQQIDEKEENQEKKSGGKKKLLLITLAVFLLAGSAAAGFFLLGDGKLGFISASTDGEEQGISVPLETFTVNLSDMGFRRYLRVDITLECYNEDAVKEIEQKKYKIRDKIITVLSQKTVSDFETSEKFERVRMELLKAVNSVLSPSNQIKALYFENFIIQ
ncbi:MAG TPA: hypothetical protein DEA47_02150 [Peptococcaceae bacterium]|nr:MAG: Flagellar basal body-associated protein FliL [Clostridia bacterium 41_269]HBT20161.1 hypothetical protein [Peptococcaceae bacterium]